MRSSVQPWGNVRGYLEITIDGVRMTGLSPTMQLRRASDGDYLQGDNSWDATPDDLPLTEASTGVYVRQISAAALDPSDLSYTALYSETTELVEETEFITLQLPLADQLRQLLGQTLMRFIPSAWDTDTGQPTEGVIYLYATTADYNADTVPDGTGAFYTEEMEALFSGGQLQHYGRKPS